MERSIPILVIVRDLLHLVDLGKEAKKVINEGGIIINGKIVKDYKFPCGFFDVISFPKIDKHYCVLPDSKGRLTLKEITKENADAKLCKVKNKTIVSGGKVQLNLHDGTNLMGTNEIKTGDSIILSLKDNKIAGHYQYKPGARAFIVGGNQSCSIGTIKEIKKVRTSGPNTVVLQRDDGSTFETVEEYVFVMSGKEESVIK
jgi:small subunit ribosomal protein S4e